MPITSSAKKALRQEKRRTIVNSKVRLRMKEAVRVVTESGKKEDLSKAYQAVDRATKKNLIHKNKAARIKSSLSKLSGKTSPKTTKTTKSPQKPRKSSKPKSSK